MDRRILSEAWAVDVGIKVATLRGMTRVAMSDPLTRADPRRMDVAATVGELLDRAEFAIQRRKGRPRGPLAVWRGTGSATSATC
jgi:hypothetical protein